LAFYFLPSSAILCVLSFVWGSLAPTGSPTDFKPRVLHKRKNPSPKTKVHSSCGGIGYILANPFGRGQGAYAYSAHSEFSCLLIACCCVLRPLRPCPRLGVGPGGVRARKSPFLPPIRNLLHLTPLKRRLTAQKSVYLGGSYSGLPASFWGQSIASASAIG
jgi:hypothetical protein